MLWHQNLVIYFVIDSMNNGFWRGCITPSYGNLIRRIDEHGDSQVDFGGCPILQRVSGQTKLVSWTISRYLKQSYPTWAILQLWSRHQHKGSQGKPRLIPRSPDPGMLFFEFEEIYDPPCFPILPNSSHAKQTPNLERAVPRQVKHVKKDLQISGINWSLITFTSQLRRKSHYAPRHKPSRV